MQKLHELIISLIQTHLKPFVGGWGNYHCILDTVRTCGNSSYRIDLFLISLKILHLEEFFFHSRKIFDTVQDNLNTWIYIKQHFYPG